MKYKMTAQRMKEKLDEEKVITWFDLGLYLDRILENRATPVVEYSLSYEFFKANISGGGIGFISFYYSVDGVTIEVEKYAKSFRNVFRRIPVHYIAGKFYPESEKLIDPRTQKFCIPEMQSFDDWSLYKDFFHTKLERGSKEYNALITKFWAETKLIANKLATYVEENNIKILYLINTCSNPGNVSMALAVVLVSELLGIPVINNSHDFYWEGGNSAINRKQKGLKSGPRDFFFTNSHLGEVFSIIEMVYPWNARHWLQININRQQTEHLIQKNGINPANISEIGTAVDTSIFQNITKRQKINTYHQFEQILSRYSNALIRYSVKDVINSTLVDKKNPKPILIGASKTKPIQNFLNENIIFLQPTRIVSRKRIEVGFKLIRRLFEEENFASKFRETENLKLTIIVTGPIPTGQYEYFQKLIERFQEVLETIPEDCREKVNLALLFSELDKKTFKKRFEKPVGIPELYNIASLVLLPSKTEGRGLPIIEASACGTPIYCRRYDPEEVYADVIGEHLPENERLRVIEFDGKNFTQKQVNKIIEQVFFPHDHLEDIEQNLRVVDTRYSLKALDENIQTVCYRLFRQLRSNSKSLKKVSKSLDQYKAKVNFTNNDLKELLKTDNREYLPGFGRLSFMLYLKSLIDPSYFRIEEMEVRGMAFQFALKLIQEDPDANYLPFEKVLKFYNSIDNIFKVRGEDHQIRHDHSLSYRHRNKNYYIYQDFTIQEIQGLIRYIYLEIFRPEPMMEKEHFAHFFTDWNLALSQLTSSSYLGIDDRDRLIEKMKECKPLAVFPGYFYHNELEFFALQPIRRRFNLDIHEELTENFIQEYLKEHSADECPVYIFAPRNSLGKYISALEIRSFLESKGDKELYLLFKYGFIQVVKTDQLCEGIHLPQIGEEALRILRKIKEQGGYLISHDHSSAFMTDVMDMDRIHIGKIQNEIQANIMGIPEQTGYIQFVPASVRVCLAYPTPIQTAKEFNEVMRSDLFKQVAEKIGEKEIWKKVKEDAEDKGSPLSLVLERLANRESEEKNVDYNFISGVYEDGFPYNGILAKAKVSGSKNPWEFVTISSQKGTKRVTDFVNEWEESTKRKAEIAWNGGYILNPELVGKLGQPESYIGSPLGLLVSNKEVLCPPLFNKATLLIYEDGKIDILKVNAAKGFTCEAKELLFDFKEKAYNNKSPGDELAFYDLLFEEETIPAKDRILVRIAGNSIKEVVQNKTEMEVIPVGLVLSFPKDKFPKEWDELELKLNIKLHGMENIKHAVEAGPLLIEDSKFNLNMKDEGWKTQNSIRTQAARLDYVDMRGPKIAIGLDAENNLYVLTINGRIRESVGATHVDMADILIKQGMVKAMGFDPGGSSTLVVNGETLNISPYNSRYEENVYALKPEPRAVANAVIGFINSGE